ncbi:diguanylate cyclase (GGDEF) domain-containing protein [Lachnospiraceae bacterium C10]|nr:diguanylate cyclase (GGDEF) domain-containing protein [Lachnospiraceae bacterium C10]
MKKLALIMDSRNRQMHSDWPKGIVQQIKKAGEDAVLYTFCCAANWSRDQEYNNGEYSIFHLPDLSDFDGVILDVSNIRTRQVAEGIVERVRMAGIPAVTLEKQVPGFPCVAVDCYSAMTRMMEHLRESHHFQNFWLMAGPKDRDVSRQIEASFRDYLKSQDILIGEADVCHQDLDIESGREGFCKFMERHRKLPDVIVCASDAQAIGVCEELKAKGWSVPKDVAVTGFECFEGAYYYTPQITTVSRVGEKMGAMAVKALLSQIKGRTVADVIYCEPSLVTGESSGCHVTPEDVTAVMNRRIVERMEINAYREELLALESALMQCRSMRSVAKALSEHMKRVSGSAFYMICDPRLERYSNAIDEGRVGNIEEDLSISVLSRTGLPKEMQVVYAREERERRDPMDQMVSGMFPLLDMDVAGDDMLLLPLHFGAYAVGYFAFKNVAEHLSKQVYLRITLMAQRRIEEMYREKKVTYMKRRLEALYKTDSLTGISNRMGYQRDGESLYRILRAKGKRTVALFCDLDHLKEINDTYGHRAGDAAILGMAAALKDCCGQNALVSRTGGDEFVVLAPYTSADELEVEIEDIRMALRQHATARHLPYELTASIGFAISCNSRDETLEVLIHTADEKMYEEKERHRRQNLTLRSQGKMKNKSWQMV